MAKKSEVETPLFPGFDCGVKPKLPRKKRPKREKDDTPPSLSVLLFPELYPEEYVELEIELRRSVWEHITPDKVLVLQWYIMSQFDEYYPRDDSAEEHYIDYTLWVLLDDGDMSNPFSYRNVVTQTIGVAPEDFAGAVALRVLRASLDYTTKSGEIFRRIRKKYERKLIELLVESDIPV